VREECVVPDDNEPKTVKAARQLLWLLPLGVMAGMALVSHQSQTPDMPRGGDKLLHGAAFGALGATWVIALQQGRSVRTTYLLSLALSALWGAVDEWHQSFVPGRDASWGDFVADGLGAALGAGIAVGGVFWRRRAGR
jgi:VanZ family protein